MGVFVMKTPCIAVLHGTTVQTGQPSATLHLAVCVQVPGGWAAQRWGGRNTLMLSFALWSTASILTPISSVSSAPIAVARMAVGVSQGLLIPSIHTVLAQVSRTSQPASDSDMCSQASLFSPAVPLHAELVCRSCRQSSAPRRYR